MQKHSKLFLMTGLVALALAGPINAPASAAVITISDIDEANSPTGTAVGFEPTTLNVHSVLENAATGTIGLFDVHGEWTATNPLAPGVVQVFNFNMNDPVSDGPICCSDTLGITLIGQSAANGGPNMSLDLHFRSDLEGPLDPLANGELTGETVHFSMFDLTVDAVSDVGAPGPIAGAGLPGLLAGFVAMLAWYRKRRAGVAAA